MSETPMYAVGSISGDPNADETAIEPQSVAADKEPKTAKMWRILRRQTLADGTPTKMWVECEALPSSWGDLHPDADDIGPAHGEGAYLVLEAESEHEFRFVYQLTVVAETKWVSA